jgi:hypothetical protein
LSVVAKPASTPWWANVGGAIVAPSAGELDVGHVTAERPPAQYENWWKNLMWQWSEYLKDGAMSGAFTFDSPVAIEGTVTIAGALSLASSLTMAVSQHVVISGTGRYKHGTYSQSIGAAAFDINTGGTVTRSAGGCALSAGVLWAPIMLPIGARVSAIRVYLIDNATGPTRMALQFWRVAAGAQTTIATSSQSLGNATEQSIAVTGLSPDIESGKFYQLVASIATGAASCTVRGAGVDYSMP